MAMLMDQQPIFKHYCKVCRKGFGCGRALGGHMRAHGIGDEHGHLDDDDQAADWDDKLGETPPSGTKRMYGLRTNPNRLKSCRNCENCGKEFSSWKSFLEHGKCTSDDDAESLLSSPESDDGDGDGRRGYAWSKGKRSRRDKVGNWNSNCVMSEEEDLAHCLVMLSNAGVDPLMAETEESCASASKEEVHRIPVARNQVSGVEKAKGVARGVFECKACKKVFNSHQALGGHRASHKKVKGCFAAKLDDPDECLLEDDVITHDELLIASKPVESPPGPMAIVVYSKRKSKVHECSICHRIFASGQALGGHKRCHWLTSNNSQDTSIGRLHQLQEQNHQVQQRPKLDKSEPLDLNLPAPADELTGIRQDNENPLGFKVPTAIYLQSWIGINSNNNDDNKINTGNNNTNESTTNVDDEADSRIKLAKLSDLKDMSLGGDSSPWLQVGIGSAANGSSEP